MTRCRNCGKEIGEDDKLCRKCEANRIKEKKGKEDKLRLEEYKIASQFVFHQDWLHWTIFSIFMVMNGILLAHFVSYYEDIGYIGKILLTAFCFFSSVAWLLITGRNEAYRLDRIRYAEYVGKKINKKILKSWQRPLEKIKMDLCFIEKFSAVKVSIAVIAFLIIFWLVSLILVLVDKL